MKNETINNVRDMDKAKPGASVFPQESKSIIGVPIVVKGRKKVVLICDSLDESDVLTMEDLQVVKYVSEKIGAFQEN